MASKKKKQGFAAPKGFKAVSSSLDGFFIVEEGNAIQGVLLGSFNVASKFNKEGKTVYKVRVTNEDPTGKGPTRVMQKDTGETDAETGFVVGVDEKGYLRKLADMDEGTEVLIVCTGKEETAKKGRQPAWTFEVYEREGGESGGGSDEDIPF